jgi:hypothetical protein
MNLTIRSLIDRGVHIFIGKWNHCFLFTFRKPFFSNLLTISARGADIQSWPSAALLVTPVVVTIFLLGSR